jgi:Arc/MetJ-type ribon-helix-helix transcriptional regulator
MERDCPDVASGRFLGFLGVPRSSAGRARPPSNSEEPRDSEELHTHYNPRVAKLTTEIPSELSRQIDRIIRDGWFPDQESVVREALSQFVDAKSFLGDSPRMLHRFAADALNDSKPEVALKFVSRALSLMVGQDITDFTLYQSLVELRVQILLVLGRDDDALASAEEAKEKLPNNPAIARWIEKLKKNRPRGEA